MKVHPWAAATAAFAAGTIAAVGISQATVTPTKIPDSTTGVITACMVKKTGAVRFINAQAGKTCNSKEKKISFNQTGPVGPAGATGATGATGPQGPSNGFVANLATTKNISELLLLGQNNTIVSLDLPAGSYVINASATGHATNATTDTISCNVSGPAGTVKSTPSFVDNALASLVPEVDHPFAVTASYKNAEAGTVRFSCFPSQAGAGLLGAGQMNGGTMTATQVGTLSES